MPVCHENNTCHLFVEIHARSMFLTAELIKSRKDGGKVVMEKHMGKNKKNFGSSRLMDVFTALHVFLRLSNFTCGHGSACNFSDLKR